MALNVERKEAKMLMEGSSFSGGRALKYDRVTRVHVLWELRKIWRNSTVVSSVPAAPAVAEAHPQASPRFMVRKAAR